MNPISICIFTSFTVSLIVLEAWLASLDGMFSIRQMRYRGIRDGLPFTGHSAMWSDVFIITPLLVAIWASYAETWTLSP
jgi:hypothetical protein